MKHLFTINDYTQQEIKELESAYFSTFDSSSVKIGKKVTGVLQQLTNNEAIFSTYGKSSVSVKRSQDEDKYISALSLGDKTSIYILGINDNKKEFSISGSLKKVNELELSDFLNSAVANSTILTGKITEMNHGGYIVNFNINDNELNLFMPHLLSGVNKIYEPEQMIGKEIDVMLEKNNKDTTATYLCSHKKYLQTLIPAEIKKLVKGGKYVGKVTGTTNFAVFIEFNGCLTGMIHKSNLDYDLADVKTGYNIEFYVKDIVGEKLFLTQILRDSLWDSVNVGDVIEGKIASIKEYGLMINLDYETKGLLHISSLKGQDINTFKEGSKIKVNVIAINKNKRQITLSLN